MVAQPTSGERQPLLCGNTLQGPRGPQAATSEGTRALSPTDTTSYHGGSGEVRDEALWALFASLLVDSVPGASPPSLQVFPRSHILTPFPIVFTRSNCSDPLLCAAEFYTIRVGAHHRAPRPRRALGRGIFVHASHGRQVDDLLAADG